MKNGVSHLYLMTEGFSPTVIDSQVLDTIRAAQRGGVQFDLKALVSPRDWLKNRTVYEAKAKQVRQEIEGRVSLRVIPRLRDAYVRDAVARTLFYRYRKHEKLIIHARNHVAADIGIRLKKWLKSTRVIVDVRGDVGAEYRMRSRQGSAYESREGERQIAILRDVLQDADRIFAVSQALGDLLVDSYCASEDKVSIFPCLADETRFYWNPQQGAEVREREGLVDKRIVVFPGSTGRWHHISATVAFLGEWMKKEPLLHFVALCPDVEKMTIECRKALPPNRFTVVHAAHKDVPGWLNASDLGILLRELDPVNHVASPTKFAEYALTGLPVAMSAGIGDYSQMVLQEKAGFWVDDSRLEESAEQAAAFMALWCEEDRSRWSEAAKARLSKGARLDDLVGEYGKLAEK